MSDVIRTLLGRGLKFPFLPTELKSLQETEGIERVNQSLFILFETPRGSRLFLPDYGTNLRSYLFEPNDDILVDTLIQVLTKDITKWEPRITVTEIKFYRGEDYVDNNILYIHISYRLINSTVSGNFVYPYNTETYDSVSANTDTVEGATSL